MPDGTWKREGPPIMMVSLDSARQWYPREVFVACNADHSQIAKLKRGENSIYPSVRWAIKKALLSAGDLYSETKGTNYGEFRNLESADEVSAMRRSLLQVAHHQASILSNDPTVDSAPTPPRSPSEEILDQQIRGLPRGKVAQSGYCDDIQSKSNTFLETASKSPSGVEVSEWNGTRPSSNPRKSAETEMASVLNDEDGAVSKSTESQLSLGAEIDTSKDTRRKMNPYSMRKETEENTASATEESNISTYDTKKMAMDEVIETAIIKGDEAKIRELLAQCYDVNCSDDDYGFTPLLLAARYRHEKVLRLLLGQGAHPRARCNTGRTTLHLVALTSEIPITETLIDLLLSDRPPFELTDSNGATPLMHACANGEFLLATRLIRHGANVRAADSNCCTALHYAAGNGKAQVISLLVDNGAELEVKTAVKNTPLHMAVQGPSDPSDTVEQLLRAGADKEAKKDTKTPLWLAIENHKKACVNVLLEFGANIEAADKDMWRAMHIAAREGQAEIIKALLKSGANIEAVTRLGNRPLHIAVRKGQVESVNALLKSGANIEAVTQNGYRPLHIAAREGQVESVKALLKSGANIEAAAADGRRTLHIAALGGQLEVIKALLDHGANPTTRTSRLLGSKPSGIIMDGYALPAQKKAGRVLLKGAEKTWKMSGPA